jgi:hypothetical protein
MKIMMMCYGLSRFEVEEKKNTGYTRPAKLHLSWLLLASYDELSMIKLTRNSTTGAAETGATRIRSSRGATKEKDRLTAK